MSQNETVSVVDQADIADTTVDVLSMIDQVATEWVVGEVSSDYELSAVIEVDVPSRPVVAVAVNASWAEALAVSYFGPVEGSASSSWPEAVQELANLMGGAIKTLLPDEEASLTLPSLQPWPTGEGIVVHLRSPLGAVAVGYFEGEKA